ncbi:MAG: serine hydrolase domain-containing protein [Gemmatimonadaceae bacterium]
MMNVTKVAGAMSVMLAACMGAGGEGAASPNAERTALSAKIDSIVSAPIIAGKVAGASIAVVKGNDTIAVRGYGKANLELDVPTPARAVYEIGSVTKQFTTAAIMQLVEQGKVSLDEDVSKYLPDVKMQGRRIPVRRLMDHTSGIKGYTEIPEFRELGLVSRPRDTLLTLVASKPFDFEPGEEQIYNNSAFFLLGLIIEKASGMPYDQYVQTNLFDKAGMKDAHYCSERVIHKGKTTGYDSDSAGPVQKAPLSHVWPYAAGSLCSSAIDLVAWNEALHRDGKIMNAASYKELITPGKLNDGTTVGYAKGIAVTNRLGRRALHHGGGINGYLSENLYFPDDQLSVVVLFNTAGPGDPDAAAESIAESVLGKPKVETRVFDGDLNRYAGTYRGRGRGRPAELSFSVDGKNLLMSRRAQGGPAPMPQRDTLLYAGGDTFTRGYTRFIFMDQGGKIVAVRVDAGAGNNVLKRSE